MVFPTDTRDALTNERSRLGARINLSSQLGPDVATTRFEPFALLPDSGTYIKLRSEFFGCNLRPGLETAVSVTVVPVRVRFFGITRQEWLPLPYHLRIHGNEGCKNA
jgi:hypothetical protein